MILHYRKPDVDKLLKEGDIKGLLKSLRYKKDSYIRKRAAGALGKIRDASALEHLVKALEDENAEVRALSAKSLGKIGRHEALDALIKSAGDPDFRVRFAALQALGEIRAKTAFPIFKESLKDREANVRIAALQAIRQTGSKKAVRDVIGSLEDRFPEVRAKAVEVLETICAEDYSELVKYLKITPSKNIQLGIISVLGNLHAVAAKKAIIPFKDSDAPDVREASMEALGRLADRTTVPLIAAKLLDSNWKVRKKAAEALGRLGDSRAIESLDAALEKEQSRDVQQKIRWAIGTITEKR